MDICVLLSLTLKGQFLYGPLCRSLTFWMLFSDSVDNDNNYNDDKSYKISMIIMLVTMILIIITVLGSIVFHTQNLREKKI